MVNETVYLVVDAPKSTAKYVESLDHKWLAQVHPLDKQANNTRIRKRPNPITLTTKQPKTSLVEEIYKKTKQQFDTTK